MKNEQQTETQLAEVKQKVQNMETMIVDFKVENDEQLNLVADYVKNVKSLKKFIENAKEKYVAPAKEIISIAKAQYDPSIETCKWAEKELKDKATVYIVERNRKADEAKAKLAERVEKGTMKPETAVKKMEAMPEVSNTVRTDTGSGLRVSKNKVAKIIDPSLVPDEFWVIDEVRVRREALEREKYGKEPIPGVIIEEVTRTSSV